MRDIDDFNLFDENYIYSPWIKIDSKEWENLTSLGKRDFYKKNVVLFNSNEFTNHVYLVDSGRVELYFVDSEGRKKIIGICNKGSIFGEIQLFDNRPNHNIARVCNDAWIYRIYKDDFLNAIYNNKNLMKIILENLATKMRILYTQIEFLCYKDSTSKVALILISMCKDFGVKIENEYKLTLTFTHNDIANMTGLSRVSVTNIIISLIKLGVLKKVGNEYYISDLDYLKGLVQ